MFQKFGLTIFKMFLKEVVYAHQSYIILWNVITIKKNVFYDDAF